MKDSPLVSIVIPLFNREELIIETLQSLLDQTYPHWEAIVIDDQSTDQSYEAASNMSANDTRIKVLKRNNEFKGAPSCRNIGMEHSTGYYVIFLDSDDLFAPYSLKERVIQFNRYKENDFLVFNSSFFTDHIGDTPVLWNTFSDEDDLNRFLRGDNVWCISSPIWKRSALILHQLKFTEFAKSSQDWEFHVKALFKEMSYQKIDGLPDFFVRRNPKQAKNAISSSHGNFDKLLNRVELHKKLIADFKFTESQCGLLFEMINMEIFNSYSKFSPLELKTLWSNIKSIKSFKSSKIHYHQLWYRLLSVSTKLTFGRSHNLVYYYKRYKSKNQERYGYRTAMPPEMFTALNEKLETYKIKISAI